MAYKEDWFVGANYVYETRPKEKTNWITFKIPNGAGGKLAWTTWLYKFDDEGNTIETNHTAAILQCFIDKVYWDKEHNEA